MEKPGESTLHGRERGAATAVTAGVLALATGSLLWVCSEGSPAILYVAIYTVALIPGLPLGFALFGGRHAAGWIAGGVLGYALSAITSSAVMQIGVRTAAGYLIAWLGLLLLTLAIRRAIRAPLIALPSWSRRDTTALLLVLLLVPALMWAPFARNGAPDRSGTRHYRAYFTADFVWHMAVTGQLARRPPPPANPFVADETMHYYWTYFTLPAVGASLFRPGGHVVEQCLEMNAVLGGLLFVSAIFIATWAAVPRATAVALAVALAMLAASVQGWYGMARYGTSLEALRGVNIGALTAWVLEGLRIDGLPRSLWWTPQHAMSCALGLVGIVAASAGGQALSGAAIVLVGTSLGASLVFSPLIGASFALIYGLSVVSGAVARGANPVPVIFRHSLAALPVLAAFAWCVFNQMWERAGSALAFGFGGLARHAPLQTLGLALGPLLVPAIAGLVIARLRPSALPHTLGVVVGLLLLYFVRLVPDPAWVGFRAGQILQITLPGLAAIWIARTLDGRRAVRWLGASALALLFLAGLPTTVIDVFNAQDTANRAMGPGFRWTIAITPAQQTAFDWIRRVTPPDAVLQMEPTVRRRETWSLLPSFAERRVGAGQALPLLMDPAHERRIELARTLYATADPREAWEIARQLGIDYVYFDEVDRDHFADTLAKFDTAPRHFELLLRIGGVAVYRVQPESPPAVSRKRADAPSRAPAGAP